MRRGHTGHTGRKPSCVFLKVPFFGCAVSLREDQSLQKRCIDESCVKKNRIRYYLIQEPLKVIWCEEIFNKVSFETTVLEKNLGIGRPK